MNYREHLAKPLSKSYIDYLVHEIYVNPSNFDIVYKLIFDDDQKVAWRAAWACQKISENHPEWFSVQKFNELVNLSISTHHQGLQRGCLSILSNLKIPETISIPFVNTCFERITSLHYAIAVQAYSMKMLYKISLLEPAFALELKVVLENLSPEYYSAGFISARNKILKQLETI